MASHSKIKCKKAKVFGLSLYEVKCSDSLYEEQRKDNQLIHRYTIEYLNDLLDMHDSTANYSLGSSGSICKLGKSASLVKMAHWIELRDYSLSLQRSKRF